MILRSTIFLCGFYSEDNFGNLVSSLCTFDYARETRSVNRTNSEWPPRS